MLISTTTENRHSNIPAGTKVTGSAAYENAEDRIKRQALQAVCGAIAAAQSIDITTITADSKLEAFFPRKNREQSINAFQDELGVDIDLLAVRNAVEWAVIISANTSLISLFFSWKLAAAGLVITVVAGWLAARFGQELAFDTVGQLAEQVAREHYRIPESGSTGLRKEKRSLYSIINRFTTAPAFSR